MTHAARIKASLDRKLSLQTPPPTAIQLTALVVTRPRSQCHVRRGPEKKPRTFRLIPSEPIGIHPRSAQSIAAFRSENAICDMDLAPNPDTAVLACAAEGTKGGCYPGHRVSPGRESR
jgi:hypothetical protein